MFICLFVCLWICFFVWIIMEHPQEISLKVLWRSDLIWLRYLGSENVYSFVCFFLFIDFFVFCFNHHGTPTWRFPQSLVKIQLDLAKVLGSIKFVFFCLFVCLFMDLFVFCFNHHGTSTGSFLKILWRSYLILILELCPWTLPSLWKCDFQIWSRNVWPHIYAFYISEEWYHSVTVISFWELY